MLDDVHIWISPGVAEKLLIHRAGWECPPGPYTAHVSGTVVVAFELGRNGDVLDPTVVAGPLLLRARVLDAVRKYRYKPYLLNGEATKVATTVSFVVDVLHGCPLTE